MIEYKQEFLKDCLDDIENLLEKHWEEAGYFKNFISIDPDIEAYISLEASGSLKCFTVRKDGILIGYLVSTVSYHRQYKNILCGLVDLFYVDKRYRVSRISSKLLDFAENCLRDDGVELLLIGGNMSLKDYEEIEIIHGKVL